MVITVVMMVTIYQESLGMNTRQILSLGLVMNISGGFAFWQFFGLWMTHRYDRMDATMIRLAGGWQVIRKGLRKNFTVICAIALGFAVLYFVGKINGLRVFFYNYGYGYNYAQAYLLIITVFVQYILGVMRIEQFFGGKLETMMQQMEEENREKLAEAMEIQRQSLEKAAKSEQLKVDLISNVSHDLKTPLTSMVGYIELLKKEELNPVATDYVEVMADKAQKLKTMIESLFSLAKASSGNIELKQEEIDMNMLIAQLFADMDDRMKASGLRYVSLLTDADTSLISDNLYLYRICQNLLENTIKYSAKGTRVFVRTDVRRGEGLPAADTPADSDLVCLEITNTASYYMDFTKDDIVERFARGDEARTTEGNGLGLAIVSTYASALGGTFDIDIDCDQFKAKLVLPRRTNFDTATVDETKK